MREGWAESGKRLAGVDKGTQESKGVHRGRDEVETVLVGTDGWESVGG